MFDELACRKIHPENTLLSTKLKDGYLGHGVISSFDKKYLSPCGVHDHSIT